MTQELPADPLSIELTVTHRRLWWHIDEGDEQPEQWEMSADIWRPDRCPAEFRHVGDISVALADLRSDINLLDTLTVDDWALEFIVDTVMEPPEGALHPELNAQISDGPPRMLILRHISLTEPWRGHGLGGPLIASALRILAPGARLAVCRVSPTDFASTSFDRVTAELSSVRMGALLEAIGFRCWRDVHVLDLRDPVLFEARSEVFDRWGRPRWFDGPE